MSWVADFLILPRKPCPRCTTPGNQVGRGQVWIFITRQYVKCSKCRGRGWLYSWQDYADQEGPSLRL